MGLSVELQDERGETLQSLADSQNLLGRLLPPNDDESYPMLASIDPYGDTVFNRMQMKRFLWEWRTVSATALSVDESAVVGSIESMPVLCNDGVHLT